MTKYEIMTDRFEFHFGTSKRSIPAMTESEIFNEYLSGNANCPTREASYDTLEEAQEAFRKRYTNHGSTYAQPGYCFWLLVGDLAWIEENEYDEDGEFDQGGDVYDISAEAYQPDEE